MVFRLFEKSIFLLPDPVLGVDLPEEGHVHGRRREFPLECLASISQRQARLPLERVGARHPFDLVWLQVFNAVVFSWRFCLCFLESFHQRLILLVGRREVGHIQLADLVACDSVELAQDPVANI